MPSCYLALTFEYIRNLFPPNFSLFSFSPPTFRIHTLLFFFFASLTIIYHHNTLLTIPLASSPSRRLSSPPPQSRCRHFTVAFRLALSYVLSSNQLPPVRLSPFHRFFPSQSQYNTTLCISHHRFRLHCHFHPPPPHCIACCLLSSLSAPSHLSKLFTFPSSKEHSIPITILFFIVTLSFITTLHRLLQSIFSVYPPQPYMFNFL